jgi:uncharacterized protein HemX
MKTRARTTATASGLTIGGYIAILLAVAALAGIGGFAWWLTVATSGARGTGNVQRDQNSASNREHWSATFNAEYQQITADQSNLTVLKTALDGGGTEQDRTNYLGAQLNCRQDVAKYNADAVSTLGSPWIPDGLPTSINANTYCGS